MKRKANPILAAIEWSLKGQRRTAIMDGWHTLAKEEERRLDIQLDIIRQFFNADTIYEVGCLVLGAVLAGDKQIVKTVRDAIKAGDHLFNRDRELWLLRPALRYMLIHWHRYMLIHKGDIHRSTDEIKRGIERECNNGKELAQHQWSRLRRALGLPKKLTFAPGGTKDFGGEVGEIVDLAPKPEKRQRRSKSPDTKKPKTVS